MGGTEELPALAQIRAEQERIKKQRQSLNSYEREGKAMFAKLRSLCAVPDREEVEEQDDSGPHGPRGYTFTHGAWWRVACGVWRVPSP